MQDERQAGIRCRQKPVEWPNVQRARACTGTLSIISPVEYGLHCCRANSAIMKESPLTGCMSCTGFASIEFNTTRSDCSRQGVQSRPGSVGFKHHSRRGIKALVLCRGSSCPATRAVRVLRQARSFEDRSPFSCHGPVHSCAEPRSKITAIACVACWLLVADT